MSVKWRKAALTYELLRLITLLLGTLILAYIRRRSFNKRHANMVDVSCLWCGGIYALFMRDRLAVVVADFNSIFANFFCVQLIGSPRAIHGPSKV